MSHEDHGARDAAIATQTYTRLRRRPGVAQERFDAYWRDVHGPLCARLPGLGFYVQHHLDPEQTDGLWPELGGVVRLQEPLDGVVEIGFASDADRATFEEASPLLFADERHFIGHDVAWSLPRGSRTLLDRQADGTPNGPDALHRLHLDLRGRGRGDDGFAAWATQAAEAWAALDDVWKVRLHLPEPYDPDDPQPPAPDVDHTMLQDGPVAFVEVAWPDRLAAERSFASEAFAASVAHAQDHVAALGVHLVREAIVYVRDGELTQAGLRGASVARVLRDAGAANQVAPEVVGLFDGRPTRGS